MLMGNAIVAAQAGFTHELHCPAASLDDRQPCLNAA
jgi:hypothetical protein